MPNRNHGERAVPYVSGPYLRAFLLHAYNLRCWDGKNLDSEDHTSHMAYPVNGTFESGAPCPDTHPVRMSQVLYETIWNTTEFNDKSLWPTDGSQPFVWSFGDS